MKLLLSTLSLCIVLIIRPAQAETDFDKDCNFILNTAQQFYPLWFPESPPTQFIDSWCFRYYDNDKFGDIYAGIYRGDELKKNGVYTLGGPFGKKPLYIDQADKLITFLLGQIKNEAICDSSDNERTGIEHRREGDNLYITTKECIKPPESQNVCDLLPDIDEVGEPFETDIHLLIKPIFSSFEITDSIPSIPGVPGIRDTLQSLENSIVTHTSCIIHAPQEAINFKVNSKICFDMSDQFGDILGAFLPVEFRFESDSVIKEVDNCFNSNATSIYNTVTKETWLKQNGRLELIN